MGVRYLLWWGGAGAPQGLSSVNSGFHSETLMMGINLDGNFQSLLGACSLTTGVPKFSGSASLVAAHVVGHARNRTP